MKRLVLVTLLATAASAAMAADIGVWPKGESDSFRKSPCRSGPIGAIDAERIVSGCELRFLDEQRRIPVGLATAHWGFSSGDNCLA